MPDPVQLPDFGELVKSFEAVANDRRVSDTDYVYVKGGKVRTEGRASHWFTSSRCKAKTAQWLQASLKARFSREVAGGSVRDIDARGFASGDHQIRVSDLRKYFGDAQRAVLNEVAQTIADEHPGAGDALAPLSARIRENRVVTASEMRSVISARYGHRAASVVLASHQDARITDLSRLMNEARAAQARLNELSEPVVQALVNFCVRGSTKAVLTDLLMERFDFASESVASLVAPAVAALPARGITEEEAVKVLKKAQLVCNRQRIQACMTKVGDPVVCRLVGLTAMYGKGLEFGRDEELALSRRLPAARADAQAFRDMAASVRQAVPGEDKTVSKEYERFEDQQILAFAEAGKTSPQDMAELKTVLETRLKRETDFDFAVNYEIGLHDWTDEQKSLYRETMDFIRNEAPLADLFVKDDNVSAMVAQVVNGDGITSLSAIEDKATFLKAVALAGEPQSGWILERMDRVSDAFKKGLAHADQLFEVLYGELAEKPDFNVSMRMRHNAFLLARQSVSEALFEHRWEETVATEAMKADLRARVRAEKPEIANDKEAVEQEVVRRLLSSKAKQASDFVAAGQWGMKFEAAMSHAQNRRLAVTLEDYVKPPVMSHACLYTAEAAQARWIDDFARQNEGTRITVHGAEGDLVVTNHAEGLGDEMEAFLKCRETSRHRTVMDALKALCGGNEKQYVLALVALSQSGPLAVLKTTGSLVDGVENRMNEHSPLQYEFTKREDGSIAVAFASPAGVETASLSGTVVIRPDGTAQYEALSVTPRPVAAG